MFGNLTKSKKTSDKIGEIGLGIALVLAIPKILLGIITGSISVLADGVNNLMDSFVSVITIIGMKMAKKPRDKDHPYGHGRIEYITGFIISIVTALIGFQFLIKSTKSIINPVISNIDTLTRIFLILSIILKSFFSILNREFYKNFKSTIFKANEQDSLFDVVISGTVLVSSFFFKNYPVLDAAVALIISLILLYTAYETLKETIAPLIGAAPSEEDLQAIEEALNSCDIVRSIHNVYVDRKSMDHVFATADVEVDPKLTIGEVHEELELATLKLKKDKKIELVVHAEPEIDDDYHKKLKVEVEKVDGVCGVHDILTGSTNYITISISANDLHRKEDIVHKVLEKLQGIGDDEWNIDVIADFN